jgi:hypothetical protein
MTEATRIAIGMLVEADPEATAEERELVLSAIRSDCYVRVERVVEALGCTRQQFHARYAAHVRRRAENARVVRWNLHDAVRLKYEGGVA